MLDPDAGARPGGDDRSVTVRRELLLELDDHSEPISGTVRTADGSARPFVGYAELVSELEALRRRPVRAVSEVESRGGVES